MENFLSYSATDIGMTREKNQDCISVLINTHPDIDAAMGIICDGVGGLQEGEYASVTTCNRFIEWFQYEFPQIITEEEFEEVLRKRWIKLVENHNRYLYEYASERHARLGTTLTVLLLFRGHYYTMQVGDSRAYEITGRVVQLTEDQSLVAQEVREGLLTKEQAKVDPRQNILLQSIGYSKHIAPVFGSGAMESDAGYLICSDGFYHHVEDSEMIEALYCKPHKTIEQLKTTLDQMIELVKQRGEKDNISVAFLKRM